MQKNFLKIAGLRRALPVAIASLMIVSTGCGNAAEEAPAEEATTEVAPAPEASTTDTAATTIDTTAMPPIDTTATGKPVGDKQPPKAN
jgi:PBP1b-binding outer membrane lipoprotein LpoB